MMGINYFGTPCISPNLNQDEHYCQELSMLDTLHFWVKADLTLGTFDACCGTTMHTWTLRYLLLSAMNTDYNDLPQIFPMVE